MRYQEDELKGLHKIELEILAETIRICEENKIPYFTVGGTTLGAIRHDGFIPWDDDIDIGMLRDDYERFISIAPKQLHKGFSLSHFSTERTSPTYYAKIKKDGTEFIEKGTQRIKMHHGIFIDVMPYDKIPAREKERKKYRRRVIIWNQLFIAKTMWISTRIQSKHKPLLNAIRAIMHIFLIFIPKAYLFEKTDKAMRAYNNDNNTNMISSRALKVFECNIGDIIPPQKHKFESIEVNIPADADKVLTIQYGNYMSLPPEGKRYSHAPLRLKY